MNIRIIENEFKYGRKPRSSCLVRPSAWLTKIKEKKTIKRKEVISILSRWIALERTRFVWIPCVKLGKKFVSMKFICCYPRKFFVSTLVTSPVNVILKRAATVAFIKF